MHPPGGRGGSKCTLSWIQHSAQAGPGSSKGEGGSYVRKKPPKSKVAQETPRGPSKASRQAPTAERCSKRCPNSAMTAQDASNHRPECLQRAPRGPRASPTSPAEKPKTGQGRPKRVPRWSRWPHSSQNGPRGLHDVPKRAPTYPIGGPPGMGGQGGRA